ncbi:MAG: hypothetical protein V4812_19305 [Pseudomonadota bacterium]
MSPAKQRSLQQLYRDMPTAEIERRVETGQLTPQAQVVAQQELLTRITPAPVPADPPAEAKASQPVPRNAATIIGGLIASSLAAIAVIYLVDPEALAIVVSLTLIMAATLIGKLMPRLGLMLGWVLTLTPIWLGGFMWYMGALTIKGADYKPLEAILAWIALIIASVMGYAIGSGLRHGARHSGSWEQFGQELEEAQQKAQEVLNKR